MPKVSQEASTNTTDVLSQVSITDATAVNKEDTDNTAGIDFSKVPATKAAGVTLSEVHTSGTAINTEDIADAATVFTKVSMADTAAIRIVPADSSSLGGRNTLLQIKVSP